MKASIRAAINRENASHSTGPVTAAGKARSSRNAWKHGLTSQVFIHTEDERPAYLEFGQELITDLRPVGAIEIQLAQKIVDSHWRLNRVPAIENNLLNSPRLEQVDPDPELDPLASEALGQAHAWMAGENSFDKLGRYEARLSRYLFKLNEEYRRAQTARFERQTREAAQVKPIAIAAAASTDPSDPHEATSQAIDQAAQNVDWASFSKTPQFKSPMQRIAELRAAGYPENGVESAA